jgi:NTE family protein
MSAPGSRNRGLVLTGGGARGAYQAGVLKYIGENIPGAHFETLVGSSAGAINVAALASYGGHLDAAGPAMAALWRNLEMREVFRTDIFSLARIGLQWAHSLTLGGIRGRPSAHYLVDTAPLRKLLESLYRPEIVRAALETGSLKNVALSATEVNTGSLVTFVQSPQFRGWQQARRRGVAATLNVDHVMASAAIPLLFPSVLLNNRQYVDGSIRSTAPLSPATRLGAEKILAIGVRRYYMRDTGNYFPTPDEPEREPSPAQLGALVLNSLFAESLDSDAEHLERLNGMLANSQAGGMKQIGMMVLRPSEDLGEMALHYQRKVPSLVRFLLRGIGSEQGKSSDILSYLLFVPDYLQALVDLGYQDARAEEGRLRAFLVD